MTKKISRRKIIEFAVVMIVLLLGIVFILPGRVGAPNWSFNNDKPKPAEDTPPKFNKNKYSLDDPSSPWLIVNKQRPMPAEYVPAGLRQPDVPVRSGGSSEMLLRDDAAAAVEKMVAAAAGKGVKLMLVSGYRSYGLQQAVYAGNVTREGRAAADQTSARPGHSEHQTGLAADLGAIDGTCQLQTCFGQTPEGRWLAGQAHKYGFIVRYPDNKQAIVGYTYEPWHMRYVGKELAAEIKSKNQTLEQFFGLPNAADY